MAMADEPASACVPSISAGIGLKNGIENQEHRGRFMANRPPRRSPGFRTAFCTHVTLNCALEDTLLREERGSWTLQRFSCAASQEMPR